MLQPGNYVTVTVTYYNIHMCVCILGRKIDVII